MVFMKRAVRTLALAAFVLPLLAVTPGAHLAPIAWLIGGTWSATTSRLPGTLRIDTIYSLASNGAFLRFTTGYIGEHDAVPTDDGNLSYDPATKIFAIWYIDRRGAIVQGPVDVDRNITIMLFEANDPRDGRPGQMRVVMTRHTNNFYTWALYNLTRDPVKPIYSLDYHRKR